MDLRGGRSPSFTSIVDTWLFVGSVAVIMLAFAVGPLVLALRRWLGPAFTPARAALVGAAAGPGIILAVWYITRESWETVGTLIRFWQRVPMEFVIGVLPFMAAGALFAAVVVSGMRAPRRREFA